jgi:hypothetical protein
VIIGFNNFLKMILLDKTHYNKAIEPLKKVTINTLFAHAVVDGCVEGVVFVDDVDRPRTFYVEHPYGMSLLFGEAGNEEFNSKFLDYSLNADRNRDKHVWMQAWPQKWDAKLVELFDGRLIKSEDNTGDDNGNFVELNTRVNFKINVDKHQRFKATSPAHSHKITRSDKCVFENMKGSVVPYYFWDNAEHFCNDGVGFSLFCERDLASTAFSAFIVDNKVEIGIETFEIFKRKGLAQLACSALIDYCLENSLEPIWSCRLENYGSYKLAQKLGFDPTITLPYYRLCN